MVYSMGSDGGIVCVYMLNCLAYSIHIHRAVYLLSEKLGETPAQMYTTFEGELRDKYYVYFFNVIAVILICSTSSKKTQTKAKTYQLNKWHRTCQQGERLKTKDLLYTEYTFTFVYTIYTMYMKYTSFIYKYEHTKRIYTQPKKRNQRKGNEK